jgi:hypothetical protein
MSLLERYSEPYTATGALAAEGVVNQLGRPDIEPLEVLVREAVQNCWDAKRDNSTGIRMQIARRELDSEQAQFCRNELLVDPPPALPLADELAKPVKLIYFADFGTGGLGGPTRADEMGSTRDFVDFVRNIGQPPDNDLGGGSFGYGKAAFYLASRARTIFVDTLCLNPNGELERRFIGCGLGYNFDIDGRPFTGRHWWGEMRDGVPEPLTGSSADTATSALGLPPRRTASDLGTTVVVVAPDVEVLADSGHDETMEFVGEAVAWNFWPRMIDTKGATRRTMEFIVSDDDRPLQIPNPRTHERLRGFVEAMDRLREEPGDDDDLLLDRRVVALKPARILGRLVIQKGPVSPVDLPERAVPVGARLTADSVHHVALMRNAELVVRYLPSAPPVVARMGYAGVFRCAVDVDSAFRTAEPPTHDNWVPRAVPAGRDRRFVNIALERIAGVAREAAGYDTSMRGIGSGAEVPLGEFADALATLMPGVDGPGARCDPRRPATSSRRRRSPVNSGARKDTTDDWMDGGAARQASPEQAASRTSRAPEFSQSSPAGPIPNRPPQIRAVPDPTPAIAPDGSPVVRYPFELRLRGNRVRLSAAVEVMSSDGAQVEAEAPLGSKPTTVRAWINPDGMEYRAPEIEIDGDDSNGRWEVQVMLLDDAMIRVDLKAEAI